MKKIFLSFSIVATFAIFATLFRENSGVSASGLLTTNVPTLNVSNAPQSSVPQTAVSDPVPVSSPTASATKVAPKPVPKSNSNTQASQPVAVATQPVAQSGQYKDGTYTGSVADAYYGNIQVQAIISGGKLSDVVFLQYPNDRNRSIAINTQAMPYLKSEAIQAQSANVNIISGASDSSSAFVQSLGDALAQAVN